MMRANDIHARVTWPTILAQLGIPERALRNKHGPCPACGGKDRFRFDNKQGRGTYICAQCGSGDGFQLLERVHGWTFAEARKRVIAAAGIAEAIPCLKSAPTLSPPAAEAIAHPSSRVIRLRGERCALEACDCAVDYLASRGLWPLPDGRALKAHASVEYWNGRQHIGRYPALVADVTDRAGELVTLHVTYLEGGRKLATHEPRKLLGPLTGREGCAARLVPISGAIMGIAEGIETALSAAVIDGVPVWSALNASLLARFEPPPGITVLRIYADRDEAGLMAALKLTERLQGRLRVEHRVPAPPAKDWNDVLVGAKMTRRARCGLHMPNGGDIAHTMRHPTFPDTR